MTDPDTLTVVTLNTWKCDGDYFARVHAIAEGLKAVRILKDDGIRSNVILPGPTLTPMQDRWRDRKDLQVEAARHVPMGRLGRPQDQAAACLFLLSGLASYITGTELVVDGGLTAKIA